MEPLDDSALLSQFVKMQSDEAFTELVARHINLVYSVALRQVGNPSSAEEITQAVFIILAKKAASLRHEKALSSWLFQTTRLTSNNFIRSEMRRLNREQEAYMQSSQNETDVVWEQIGPVLDDAVTALGEKDRRAILLRYYEGRSLRDVGAVLGVSEGASEKRVARALEKLRKFFFKRGLPSAAAAIAGSISSHSVQPAPIGLTQTISTVALAKSTVASASTLALVKGTMKITAWANIKTAIVAGTMAVLLAGATTVSINEIFPRPGPFVKITGKGQIELYNYFKKARVIETANMTIWTDGKLYRISIDSKGDGILTNDADDMQAQYGSDGIDTFVLSDQLSYFNRTNGGQAAFAYEGRFPNERVFTQFVPWSSRQPGWLIVRAIILTFPAISRV